MPNHRGGHAAGNLTRVTLAVNARPGDRETRGAGAGRDVYAVTARAVAAAALSSAHASATCSRCVRMFPTASRRV